MEYDLSGEAGNAFAVLGNCEKWAKQLGLDWNPICEDMMSGDYNHLIEVAEEHFGTVVTFINNPEEDY